MSRVFVIGAPGKVGRRFVRQLAERGHQPLALHRNPEQTNELEALGATPVSGSLIELDVSGLARLMAGSDVVVFSAGAGGKGGMEMTNAIDGRGLELSVASAPEQPRRACSRRTAPGSLAPPRTSTISASRSPSVTSTAPASTTWQWVFPARTTPPEWS